jgi:hypothetical protein
MSIDSKVADSYLRDTLLRFDKEKSSLSETELRMLTKYKEYQLRSNQLGQEVDQLTNQIEQAKTRLRTMELQTAEAQGKAQSVLEILVSMKFDEAPVAPEAPEEALAKTLSPKKKTTKESAND